MAKNVQKINYKKLFSTNDWDYYKSDRSTIGSNFTKSNMLNTNLNDKNFGNNHSNIENADGCTNKDDCLICYNKVEKQTSKVSCKLCSNIVHYGCYNEFIEKNNNYINKCCVCSTKTLKFDIKHWWNCCW
jgi:hypothetical protein